MRATQGHLPGVPVTKSSTKREVWLDAIRAFAMVWVFFNHVSEKVFAGGPFFANPRQGWPDLGERLEQIEPLTGGGVADVFWNPLRYVGWLGDTGVQLFIIATGFVLTRSMIQREREDGAFRRHRLSRLFPTYWVTIFLAMLATTAVYILGFGPDGFFVLPWEREFWLSLLGFRADTGTLYWGSPSWWYIGLLVQFYLVFPYLWRALRSLGPTKFLLFVGGASILVRLAGLVVFSEFYDTYLDAWSRGAIFVTRLPELVFGMSLAWWMVHRAEASTIIFRNVAAYFGLLLFVDGFVTSVYLVGNAVSPALLGIGSFLILTRVYRRFHGNSPLGSAWLWISEHSLAIFLVHHHAIRLVVPTGTGSVVKVVIGIVLAAILTLIGAVVVERLTEVATHVFAIWRDHGLLRSRVATIGVAAVSVMAILAVASGLTRSIERHEVAGWGERPSLVTDDVVGWHLRPNSTTDLAWISYDYTVVGNNLGFPGPDIVLEPAPEDTVRVWVTGDAFSSAEGVDTDKAWPRLLETQLGGALGNDVDVVNFSVTGWGPNQEAAALETWGPELQPDVIIVQAFVNDFGDVMIANEDFQDSIGFGERSINHPLTFVELRDMRAVVKNNLVDGIRERVQDKPNPLGFGLGNFTWVEDGRLESGGEEQLAVQSAYARMQAVADSIGAELVVVMVPASVQVCSPAALDYYPEPLDLTSDRWDLDQPQRLMQEVTDDLGIQFHDLRPALSEGLCPFQPNNMHLVERGHELLAADVARWLASGDAATIPAAP